MGWGSGSLSALNDIANEELKDARRMKAARRKKQLPADADSGPDMGAAEESANPAPAVKKKPASALIAAAQDSSAGSGIQELPPPALTGYETPEERKAIRAAQRRYRQGQ